jgi:hypothetical protein
LASSITKEIKFGKLPFRKDGDRIARYGRGFSNLLSLVGSTPLTEKHQNLLANHNTSYQFNGNTMMN